MKHHVDIKAGNHKWDKTNLVTITKGHRSYDEFKCKCGLKAKSTSLSSLEIDGRSSRDKVNKCPLYEAPIIPSGQEFKVVGSPFGTRLPNGSIIVMIERQSKRESNTEGDWYVTKDGSNPFKEENNENGSFKLFGNEVTKVH